MDNETQFDIAFRFVECINRLDIDGLAELMTKDHLFSDLAGDIELGKIKMLNAWRDYMSRFPEYMIHISEVFEVDDEIILVGRTTGSHLQIPRREEFTGGTIIWVAKIRGDKVTEWQLYYDTPENKAELNMTEKSRIA